MLSHLVTGDDGPQLHAVVMQEHHRGFTLAEFAIALSILGLALALTIPTFQRSLRRAQQERVPAELQSDLQLAITTAKASGRTVQLEFDSSGYRIRDTVDSTLIRDRKYDGQVSFASSGDPLVFPWGMVQPAEVQVWGSEYDETFRILPTGKMTDEPVP